MRTSSAHSIRGQADLGQDNGPRDQFHNVRLGDVNGDGRMDLISADPGEVRGVSAERRGMIQALYGPFARNSDTPYSHWYSDWAGGTFDPAKIRIVKFTSAIPLAGVRRGA